MQPAASTKAAQRREEWRDRAVFVRDQKLSLPMRREASALIRDGERESMALPPCAMYRTWFGAALLPCERQWAQSWTGAR